MEKKLFFKQIKREELCKHDIEIWLDDNEDLSEEIKPLIDRLYHIFCSEMYITLKSIVCQEIKEEVYIRFREFNKRQEDINAIFRL